jgi:SAM-dependent methyltransferase
MPTTWERFFPGELSPASFADGVLWHRQVIEQVRRRASPPARVLEAGCGLGAPAIYLADRGYHVTAVDLSTELVGRARTANARWGARANFLPMDLLHLGFGDDTFDIAYNHGVLEHFPDDRVQAAVREILRVAQIAVLSVPTVHHPTCDCGDERLLPVSRWLELLQAVRVVEVLGWHHRDTGAHRLYRACAFLGRRLLPSLVDRWQTALFATQAIFVVERR